MSNSLFDGAISFSLFWFIAVSLVVYDLKTCMCRFYLCMWCKDDQSAQQKLLYQLSRVKSKAIVRDSGGVSSSLTRDAIKKITLALGQNNSFSRGFDKILHMLLVSELS